MISQKSKLTKEYSKPRYTESNNENGKNRGWYRNGIKIHNELVMIMKINRENLESKEKFPN